MTTVVDPRIADREMIVPEERHRLQKGVGRLEHPAQPPGAQFIRRGGGGGKFIIVDGAIESRRVRVRTQQPVDGSLRTVGQRLPELAPTSAERGAPVEMSRQRQGPRPRMIGRIRRPRPGGIVQLLRWNGRA